MISSELNPDREAEGVTPASRSNGEVGRVIPVKGQGPSGLSESMSREFLPGSMHQSV